jgi:hypothetical protein
MGRISGLLHNAVDRLNRGPVQTYDGARAELGGAPWREAPKSTDAWFILDDEVAATSPPPRRRALLAGIGAASLLTTLALAIVLSSAKSPPSAAAISPANVSAPARTAAEPAAAAIAPSPGVAARLEPAVASPRTRPPRGHHASPSHRQHHRSH